MKKILVTGIDGYIGSRVVQAFAALSCYDVYGLSRRGGAFSNEGDIDSGLRRNDGLNQNSDRNDDVQFIHGDYTDKAQMLSVMFDIQPDVVIHCAGLTPHKNHRDDDYFRVNFDGGKALVEAMATVPSPQPSPKGRGGKMALINCSTIGVYGVPCDDGGFVNSLDDCVPLSPYAQSKYNFEEYLNSQTDIKFINLRIANIPGRDAFINYVLNNQKVMFHGREPYIRDYIHMDDLCDVMVKSADYLYDGGTNVTLNAGSGLGLSFHDIVDRIEIMTGQAIDRHYADIKTGDVVKIICDISETQKRLGWVPRHSNLDQILRYAIDNASI